MLELSELLDLIRYRKSHWESTTGDNCYYKNKNLTPAIRKQIFDTLLSQSNIDACIHSLDFNTADGREKGDLALAIQLVIQQQDQDNFNSASELDQVTQIINGKRSFILHEYNNWLELFLKDDTVILSNVRAELSMLNTALRSYFNDPSIENIIRQNPEHPLIKIYKQLRTKRDTLLQQYAKDINPIVSSSEINLASILISIRDLSSELAATKVFETKDEQLEIILKSLTDRRDAMLKPMLDSADKVIENPDATGFDVAREIAKLYLEVKKCKFKLASLSDLLYSGKDPIGVRIMQLSEHPAYKKLLNPDGYTVPKTNFSINQMNLYKSLLTDTEKQRVIAFYTAAACMSLEERKAFKNVYFYTTAGLTNADNFHDHLKFITSAIKDHVEYKMQNFKTKNASKNKSDLEVLLSDATEHLSDTTKDLVTKDNRSAVLDCAVTVETIKFLENKIAELANSDGLNVSSRKIKRP